MLFPSLRTSIIASLFWLKGKNCHLPMVGISINLSKGHKNKSESANLASVKIDQCYEAESWYTSMNFYFSQSLFEMNKMHHIFFFLSFSFCVRKKQTRIRLQLDLDLDNVNILVFNVI